MAKEVTRPVIYVSVDDSGSLTFQVSGFNPIELWGIAKQLEKFGDELAYQQKVKANLNKPRLITP